MSVSSNALVRCQACFLELPRLIGIEHSESRTDFQVHRSDLFDHLQDPLEARLASV